MITATLQEAKAKLHQLVEKARSGETVVLMRGSEIVAEIKPLSADRVQVAGEGNEQRKRELVAGLEDMLPVIIQKYQPDKIILFGSMATGRVHSGSDLDLLIIKRTKKRPLDRRKELIQLVRPKVAADFFVYTPEEFEKGRSEGKAFFLKEVGENGKVLYEKTA